MKRVLIAINLPFRIKEKLKDLLLKLEKENKGRRIKWVKSEILHLTLHFLGDLSEEKIEWVKDVLKKRMGEYHETEAQLGQIGGFPSLKEPFTIFLEVKEKENILSDLQKKLGNDLRKKGFNIDERLWRAHITLGRVKENINLKSLDYWRGSGEKWLIKNIDLMESILTSFGAKYGMIERYVL